MVNIYDNIIGSGALFPIELTPDENGNQGWHTVHGDPDLINHNLTSLMNYTIGQRFREEDFGTRLWECIEEPNTQALNYMVNTFLRSAISKYENRITFKGASITRVSSKIQINFNYVINTTNASGTGTLVYDSINNTLTT